jgi:hypothetical protein
MGRDGGLCHNAVGDVIDSDERQERGQHENGKLGLELHFILLGPLVLSSWPYIPLDARSEEKVSNPIK